jgi:hypothetical protein
MNSTLTISSATEASAITSATTKSEKSTIPERSLIRTRSSRCRAEMLEGFAWILAAFYLVGAVALGVAFAVLQVQPMTGPLPF